MDRIVCKVVRDNTSVAYGDSAINPRHVSEAAAKIAFTLHDDAPGEVFMVLHVNYQHQIVAWEAITRGVLGSSLVSPREVFRSAIIRNAAALIVAHNHPSGKPEPSPEDIEVTKMLAEAGAVVGIPVLDHVITGRTLDNALAYYSFAESGTMPTPQCH